MRSRLELRRNAPPAPARRLFGLSLGGPARRAAAFTLVEVILAIAIATGILVVALYFYAQAVDLRSRLLEETDRISSIRLFYDRVTSDLRAAFAQPQAGFTGDATSMRFVVAGVPPRSTFTTTAWTRSLVFPSDLGVVTYGTRGAADGTNTVVLGITRPEEPLLDTMPVAGPTNSLPAGAGADAAASGGSEPWIDTVHFLQLAYWDGTGWADRWDSSSLPVAVDVSVGVEPLPPDTDPLDYPYELYRRVIYLPGSRGNEDPPDLFAGRGGPQARDVGAFAQGRGASGIIR